MNSRQFLTTLAALLLAGCDLSSTAQEGTSSETQTVLQAFADSVSQVVSGSQQPSTTAARSMKPDQEPYFPRYVSFEYQTGIRFSSDFPPFIGLLPDSVGAEYWFHSENYDSTGWTSDSSRSDRYRLFVVSRYTMFHRTDEYSWIDGEIDTGSMVESGYGRTRAGFQYSWRRLDALDVPRLGLAAFIQMRRCGNFHLFSLGNQWEVIVPCEDTLPVFHRQKLVGRMIIDSSVAAQIGWSRPVETLRQYRLYDLEWRRYDPVTPASSQPWFGDSIGITWGTPIWDSARGEFSVPARWLLLPGTAEATHRATFPDSLYAVTATSRFGATLSIASDSGSGTLRISDHVAGSRIDELRFDLPSPYHVHLRGFQLHLPARPR